ncbi:hypothetical protein [Eoetvoesiella caeni]
MTNSNNAIRPIIDFLPKWKDEFRRYALSHQIDIEHPVQNTVWWHEARGGEYRFEICDRKSGLEPMVTGYLRGGNIASWGSVHQIWTPSCRDANGVYVISELMALQGLPNLTRKHHLAESIMMPDLPAKSAVLPCKLTAVPLNLPMYRQWRIHFDIRIEYGAISFELQGLGMLPPGCEMFTPATQAALAIKVKFGAAHLVEILPASLIVPIS